MKTSFKKLPGSKITFEVTLDAAEFKAYYDAALERAVGQVELKGFRKGTAPRELAETVLDKDKVFHAATEEAVRRTLHDESEAQQWTLIDTPKIEVLEASPTGTVGLKYKAELTIFPHVELGDYKKIARSVFSESREISVEPAEVERSLTWLRDSRAALTAVTRGAESGDLLDIDFAGSVAGTPIPGAQAKGDRFVLGKSHFLPGFDDQLKGKRDGDAVEFSLTVPDKHWEKSIAGKAITFKIKVNAVYARAVPELTDEFARGLGSNFPDATALRASIEEGMRKEKGEQERERKRGVALSAIVKASRMDIPDIMIQKTLDRMIVEVKESGAAAGKTDEELRTTLTERARENVARHLVMHRIAEAERLTPTLEEVTVEARAGSLDLKTHYDYSYGVVQNRKVFSFLESQTNG